MSNRRRVPISQVTLYAKGDIYSILKNAWATYADAEALLRNGIVSSVLDVTADVFAPSEQADRATGVYDVEPNVFRCQSWIPTDYDGADMLETFAWGTSGNETAERLPGIAHTGVMVGLESGATCQSLFEIGRDCWFGVVLWRPKLEDAEDHPNDATSITWGRTANDGWSILWPQGGGRPMLMYYDKADASWKDGTQVASAAEYAEGQLLALTIGVSRGQIEIIDNLSGERTHFARDGVYETAHTSPIEFLSTYREMFVGWAPAKMFTTDFTGRVTCNRDNDSDGSSEDILAYLGAAGAGPDGNKEAFAPQSADWSNTAPPTDPDWDDLESTYGFGPGDVAIAMKPGWLDEVSPPGGSDTSRVVDFSVRLWPWEYADSFTGNDGGPYTVTTQATPLLGALGLRQEVVLSGPQSLSVDKDLTALGLVKSINLDEPNRFGSGQIVLELDNQGGDVKDIEDFQAVTVTNSGWLRIGGADIEVSNFDTYWTLEPELEGSDARAYGLDLLSLLGIPKFSTDGLVIDGFVLADAVELLLESYGIGPTQYDIEDIYDPAFSTTAGKLTTGLWDKPLWISQPGRSPLEFISELVSKCGQNAALWATVGKIHTGCRYCGTKRSGDPSSANYWAKHQDNGWKSSGCLAADVARAGNPAGVDLEIYSAPHASPYDPDNEIIAMSMQAYTTRLDSREYANMVIIIGEEDAKRRGGTGKSIVARAVNAAEVSSVGRVIPYVETARDLNTQARVDSRAVQLRDELSSRGSFIRATCLYDARLRRGFVARINTSTLDRQNLDGRKFRIFQANQTVSNQTPMVALTGRDIT